MKGLYVHIPFCKSICSYCDFPKMMAKDKTYQTYLEHLFEELKSYRQELQDVRSVYIGGGTPNALPLELLERLLQHLAPYLKPQHENTIEVNPELLTPEQVRLFARYHINRVSIGVQTFDDQLLKVILRKHNYSIVQRGIQLLLDAGISNLNIDMMVGLPGQSMKSLEQDLKRLESLPVKHVSYYSLILEEKTILNHQIKHHQIQLPEDDFVADMLIKVNQFLKMKQFIHYEISNYALQGYQSVHNLGYWNVEEYVGIGAGAAGYLQNKRYTNHILLSSYYEHPIFEEETLSIEEQKREFMMLGLRKLEGVSLAEYQRRFHSILFDDFDIEILLQKGLVEIVQDYLRIKEDKILLGNLVFEAFVR